MQIKRWADAKGYEANNHRGYHSMRLHGLDQGGPEKFSVGISHFLPGGGAGPDSSPIERVYVILEGELVLIMDGKEHVLKKYDSCYIGPNEAREIINRTTDVVTILVVLPSPPKS
jgi:quercetin dioxygenase-like cupin family protein